MFCIEKMSRDFDILHNVNNVNIIGSCFISMFNDNPNDYKLS